MTGRRTAFLLLLGLLVFAFLAGLWWGRKGAGERTPVDRKVIAWVDPMHPSYRSDKPGYAPDCGMPLEPVYDDKTTETGAGSVPSSLPAGTVRISPEGRRLIGLRVEEVRKTQVPRLLRTLGQVAADETRTYRINATIDGWITGTTSVAAGSLVRKNQVLATFYSPEFLSAGQAFLFALDTKDRVRAGEAPGTDARVAQFEINIRQYRDSLRNLGMGEAQVDEMVRTRKFIENVDITSPADAFVLTRNVSAGQRFDKGTELFQLADLARIWILADLYEDEAVILPPGTVATVIARQLRKTIPARVSESLPKFDTSSRTLKVRLEADNPEFAFKPGMFVDVELPVTFPPALTVPVDAVLDTGLRSLVYVDRGDGLFEPRKVETGWRSGDRVEINSGLSDGERIVVSGNFLLDSESRLRVAAAGISGRAAVDPSCGHLCDADRAKSAGRTSEHQGRTYFFCSDGCKEEFDRSPASVLAAPPEARGAGGRDPSPP